MFDALLDGCAPEPATAGTPAIGTPDFEEACGSPGSASIVVVQVERCPARDTDGPSIVLPELSGTGRNQMDRRDLVGIRQPRVRRESSCNDVI